LLKKGGKSTMKKMATRKLVLYALFIALIFLLGLTPVGLIPLGFINVTILCIPTIIGTIVLGMKAGILLGFFFGLASTLSAFGISMVPQSALAAALLGVSPLDVIVMSFIPRLLVPVVTSLVYQLCCRKKQHALAVAPAAVLGSLTNTVFYLGLMLLFYTMAGLDSAPVLGIIGGTGIIAGSLEAVAAAVIATPCVMAIRKMYKAGK